MGNIFGSGHDIIRNDVNSGEITGDTGQAAVGQEAQNQYNAVNNRQAPSVGNATQAGYVNAGNGATIDQTQQNQYRGDQSQLISQLQQQAAGQGPSVAGEQLKAANQQNVANTMAMAASQRGAGNAALGARQAMQQNAASGQQTAQQAVAARMQEQLNAQGQLGNLTTQARQQDIGLAGQQAQLQQQAQLTQAGLNQQANLQNAQAQNQYGLANMQSQLQQEGLNDAQIKAIMGNQTMLAQSQRDANLSDQQLQANNIANLNNVNQGLAAQGMQNTANVAGGTASALAMMAMMSDEDNKTNVADASAPTKSFLDGVAKSPSSDDDSSSGWGIFSKDKGQQAAGGMFLQSLQKMSDEHSKKKIETLQAENQGMKQMLSATSQAEIADRDAQQPPAPRQPMLSPTLQAEAADAPPVRMTPEQQHQMFAQALASMRGATAQGMPGSLGQPVMNHYASDNALDVGNRVATESAPMANVVPSTLGPRGRFAMMSEGTKAMSDEESKKVIVPSDNQMGEFLNQLKAHQYEYKEPEKFGYGKHVSPMAQELEKTEVGKTMVKETPEGKMVDYGKGFGALLAAQATLNERLKKLEGK